MGLAAVGIIAFNLLIICYVLLATRRIKEHEQGVLLRFGRFKQLVGPGLQFIVPFVDQIRRVDLRTLEVTQRIDANGGQVKLWGENWPAKALRGEEIAIGTPIEVAALEGRWIVVRRSETASSARGTSQIF